MVQPDFIERKREEFDKLLSRVKCPKPGVYDIKVAKVLGIGSYMVQPEVAVVRDTKGRIWAIPEGENLVSRYDIKKGVKLRATVIKKDVVKFLVIERG